MTKNTLDDLSTAIEKVAQGLRGGAAATKRRMPLGKFVRYALGQVEKAAKDEPDVAKRRLAALKRSVDDAIAKIAKMVAEDTDSEKIRVEVETAFAPTRSDGDTSMADLTTASDQSSSETPLTSVSVASGSSFAENLNAVGKVLERMKAELDAPPGAKPRKPTKKADRSGGDGDGAGGDGGDGEANTDDDAGDRDGWPLDLNTEAFRKGDAAPDASLIWGADPDGLAAPKRR